MRPQDRASLSRRALIDAFNRLFMDLGYDNLTVQALVDEAGLGYATFYRHYKNMDELALAVMQSTIDELLDLIAQQATRYGELLALFSFVHDNQGLFRRYHAISASYPAHALFSDTLITYLLERYEERDTNTVPITVGVNHWVESTWYLIGFYLDNMDQYAAGHMAILLIELTIKTLESTMLVLRPDWLENHPDYLTEN